MRTISILVTLLLLVSCKSPSYLTKPKDFKYHVKGLYFETEIVKNFKIIGEIIEVNDNEIKILPINSEKIIAIEKDRINSADIIVSLTGNEVKKINILATVTALSTVPHGWFWAITLPISLTTSIATAQSAAKATYRVKYPDDIDWSNISKFARFPQGIPENIDINRIQ